MMYFEHKDSPGTSNSAASQERCQKSSEEQQNQKQEIKGKPEEKNMAQSVAKRKLDKDKEQGNNKMKFAKECVNQKCPRKSDFFQEAPRFVLAFYYVEPKNKIRLACADCYEHAVATFEKMGQALLDNLSITDVKIPQKQEIIEIIDSDDDEPATVNVPSKEKIPFTKKLEDEIESILNGMCQKIDFRKQNQSIRDDFTKRIDRIETENLQVQEELVQLERSSKKIYDELYAVNRPKILRRPSIDLDSLSKTQTESSEPPANAENCATKTPPVRKFIDIAFDSPTDPDVVIKDVNFHYAIRMRSDGKQHWDACRLLSTHTENDGKKTYKIEFVDKEGNQETLAEVPGKELALDSTNENLRAGARVIARFYQPASDGQLRGRFLPGVVGERLCEYNQHRYLIFCDYGLVQYVRAKDVREIAETSENVWEDCHPNLQQFIQNYLQQNASHQLRLLNVRINQQIPTEYKGKWHIDAVVKGVDASLVKIYFPQLDEERNQSALQWLYRGSRR